MTDIVTTDAPPATPAATFHETFERLMHDVAARERPLQLLVAENTEAIPRLIRERNRLADNGFQKEAQELNPQIQDAMLAIKNAMPQLQALLHERESIQAGNHPGIQWVARSLHLQEAAALREKQEAEHKAALAEFESLVTPDDERAAKLKEAAARLVHAAHAIGTAPPSLAHTVAGAASATPRAEA